MPNFVKIAWQGKHFGEEPPLAGDRGAGAIFFTGCDLRCVYCQNYQISQQGVGKKYSVEQFSGIMLGLEHDGVGNIDLVSPTIWAEPVKQAIKLARRQGLKLPIIWNSNAYEDVELIKSLAGLVEVYLPDFKYAEDDLAFKYSGVKNYTAKAKAAISEMFKQAGYLQLDKQGQAKRGLIVRHLILPGCIDNSLKALELIREIDGQICVSLMSQYQPVFRAENFPEINRNISQAEYEKVFARLIELGLDNGWTQAPESGSQKAMLPDFRKEQPFS